MSLTEVLVAITISSLAFAGAGSVLAASRNFSQTQVMRNETVQALRATIDTVTRDLRLSGACMPNTGDFSPIDGVNNGTTDTITTRTGLVLPNLLCIHGNLTADAAQNTTALTLDSVTGFVASSTSPMAGYISNPITGTGQDFIVTGISGNTITSNTPMNQVYAGTGSQPAYFSSVYAVQKRTYTIDSTTNPSFPVLTIQTNNQAPMQFASGITQFNVQYVLNRNCTGTTCDTLDLPTATSDWQLVKEILFTVTARSQTVDATGTYYQRTSSFTAKPRNLIPLSD